MAGLQFSNTSSRELGLVQDCEDNCNFAATQISGNPTLLAQFTRVMNTWYQKIVTMIFDSQDAWDWDDSNASDYAIATTNLVANQQDYGFPVSLSALRIQDVQVTFDGVTWRRAMPFDVQETAYPTDSTSIGNNFYTDTPYYDLRDNALFIYPIPPTNVTAGLKIFYLRGPSEFVVGDTTKAPGFDAPFHRMISLGASYDYCLIKNLPQVSGLATLLADYEARLKRYYGRKDEDRNWALKSGYTSDYYN